VHTHIFSENWLTAEKLWYPSKSWSSHSMGDL